MDYQFTIQLIEAVKDCPLLYKKQATGTTEQKNAAWNEIAKNIDQTPKKCKAKWRNLRDSYQKAVKWRQELEEIGKMSSYRTYKHEEALSFLEVGSKRTSSDGEKRQRSKKPKLEYFDNVYTIDTPYSPSNAAVEYLIEADRNDADIEEEQEEQEIDETVHEITTEHDIKASGSIKSYQEDHHEYIEQFNPIVNETESSQNPDDDIPYQEAYVNETPVQQPTDLDSWMSSIKETLRSFPKLLRAKAKKAINDMVSEYEIQYLESLE